MRKNQLYTPKAMGKDILYTYYEENSNNPKLDNISRKLHATYIILYFFSVTTSLHGVNYRCLYYIRGISGERNNQDLEKDGWQETEKNCRRMTNC